MYMTDEEIENTYSPFFIEETVRYSFQSGALSISFLNRESVFDNFIRYDDGRIAFEHWYPSEIYKKLVAVAERTLREPIRIADDMRRTGMFEEQDIKNHLDGKPMTLPASLNELYERICDNKLLFDDQITEEL